MGYDGVFNKIATQRAFGSPRYSCLDGVGSMYGRHHHKYTRYLNFYIMEINHPYEKYAIAHRSWVGEDGWSDTRIICGLTSLNNIKEMLDTIVGLRLLTYKEVTTWLSIKERTRNNMAIKILPSKDKEGKR